LERGIPLYHGYATIMGLFLTLLMPTLLLQSYGGIVNLNLLLIWSIIFYSGTRIAFLVSKGEKRIIDLTFYIFVFVWLGYIPFLQQVTNSYPLAQLPMAYSESEIRFGLYIVILGLLSFEAGKFAARVRVGRDPLPTKAGGSVEISLNQFYAATILSIAISAIIILSLGGPSVLFSARQELNGAFGDKTKFLILNTLMRVPVFVTFIYGIICWKMAQKKTVFFGATLVVLAVVNFTVNNFISSPRYWFGSILLTTLFILLRWKRGSFATWSITILMLLLLVFPSSDMFRHTTDVNFSGVVQNFAREHERLAVDGDFDAFQMIMNTVRNVENKGFSNGEQLLVAILFFIPRSIWSDKPFGTGQTVASNLGYDFTNLSCPLWAEIYHDFGLPGIGILFFVYGYFVYVIQMKFIQGNVPYLSIFVPFYAWYQIFLLRGELLSGSAYLMAFFGISYSIYWVTRRKKKRSNMKAVIVKVPKDNVMEYKPKLSRS